MTTSKILTRIFNISSSMVETLILYRHTEHKLILNLKKKLEY